MDVKICAWYSGQCTEVYRKYFPEESSVWYIGRKIRFYDCIGSEKIRDQIIEGYKKMFDRVGLNFQCINADSTEMKQKVEGFTNSDGLLKIDELAHHLFEERLNKPQYGQTLIVDKALTTRDWGHTLFSEGVSFIQPKSIEKLSQHEAGRFCSVGHGYQCETDWCLMQYVLPSLKLCSDCSDWIKYFWLSKEDKTGINFFKTRPVVETGEIESIKLEIKRQREEMIRKAFDQLYKKET